MAVKQGKQQQQRKAKPSERKAVAKARVASAAPVEERESRERSITEFPDLVDVLPDLTAESIRLAIEIATREARRKEIAAEVGALLVAAEWDSIGGDDWVAFRSYNSGRKTLKPEKLMQLGVDADVIEASYEIGKPSWSTTVKAKKAASGGSNNGDR